MKFELDTSGLDKLKKDLDRQIKNAERLNGEHEVSFDELFPDSFMQEYTNFENIDYLEDKSKFNWKDISSIPDDELDSFVNRTTSFENWQEMLDEASQLWVNKQLFK
ncbi:hypothetical protein HZY86_02280 [Aerococcaceae bacterium DSM 111020]|nr:hypothetical protein [Aerococcaceae bacterium DSM 111020]